MGKKKVKKEPRELIRNITYGEKDIVDCFKAIIKAKIGET